MTAILLWEKFETAYNTELGNDLGNVVQRVAMMISRYQAGVIKMLRKPSMICVLTTKPWSDLKFNEALGSSVAHGP